MSIYRMGNFFKKTKHHLVKNGSQHVLERQSDPALELTHFVRFRIEQTRSYALRDLEIEYYSNQTLRIFIRAVKEPKQDISSHAVQRSKKSFLDNLLASLKLAGLKDEDHTFTSGGRFYAGGANRQSLRLNSLEAFQILIAVLQFKIPPAMFNDLTNIFSYMNGEATIDLKHQITQKRSFFTSNNNEHVNRLFDLVRTCYEGERGDTICSDFNGRWQLMQPNHMKQPLLIRQIKDDGSRHDFYLVRSKLNGGFRLLKSYGRAPFEAYGLSIKQKYRLAYQAELHDAFLDLYDDGKGDPTLPLFKRVNNRWELAQKTIPQLMHLPSNEFDWLISYTAIDPNQLDETGHSLVDYIVRESLADCLGMVLTHGINPHTAYGRYSIDTLYDSIYNRVCDYSSSELIKNTELNAMWRYFQPKLRKAPALASSISIFSSGNCIHTQFIILNDQEVMEFETLFKPVSLVTKEEYSQFLAVVEENFNSLITEHDKDEFAMRVAKIQQPLTIKETNELWCSFIEKCFNCALSQKQQDKFLALMSIDEQTDFHKLIHSLNDKDAHTAFWTLVDKSMVRYSFDKDISERGISTSNKFVELAYKKSRSIIGNEIKVTKKFIAGFIHELLILPEDRLKKNKRVVWHYALAAKKANEPTASGFVTFTLFRPPFSLGLTYNVAVIGFTLNTNSYAFVAELPNVYPKHRSQQKDELVRKLIKAIHGEDVAIYQHGAAYYIQDYVQAKRITPSVPLHEYLFKKLNDTADGDRVPTAKYRAVPTFFSGSCKKNREQFNTLLSSSAHHEAHLKEFFTLFEPIIQPLTSNTQMLAKL